MLPASRLTLVLKSKNLSSGFPIVLKTIQLIRADEDNFSSEPLTPELSEASFAPKTIVAVETPERPCFSRLARSLLLKL